MRVLITGITGFVGGHLTERLLADGGHRVVGLSRHARWPADLAHLADRVELHACDLIDVDVVERLVRQVEPERVFHLAGYANPKTADANPDACRADNCGTTESLCRAVAASPVRPRILVASSGHVYGKPDRPDEVCTEETPLRPRGVYAESKRDSEAVCERYVREAGLDIVRVRLFNQIGPRQARGFVVPDYAIQVADVLAGRRPAVEQDDLSACRDLCDVRDVVVALDQLMQSTAALSGRVFNAASGTMVQLQHVLDRLVALAGRPIPVRKHGEPRPDVPFRSVSVAALCGVTGWQPTYTLEQTLADVLDYWRNKA